MYFSERTRGKQATNLVKVVPEATFAKARITLPFVISLVFIGLSVGFLYLLQLCKFTYSYSAFNFFLLSDQAFEYTSLSGL